MSFKYRYIYYFYAAKYLADNFTQNESSKGEIKSLIENLHKEDCSNIIIFITHHTKNEWIFDEIQYCMMEMFEDSKEAQLNTEDLGFMTEFMNAIPQLVLEQREIAEERRTANINKDVAENIENELDAKVNKLDPADILARTMKSFKAIELIGQIARNRYGSLQKDLLISML
ncbi:hypothetical protein P4E94_19605, partial [Pontiellaceae bacterium B12219]|nr:hypothetical protein [Pontiellaceae bacterium B12219]